MTAIIVLIHIFIDGLFGWSILQILGESKINLFNVAKAVAIGMFAETMLIGMLHYFGVSVFTGFIVFVILSLSMFIINRVVKKRKIDWDEPMLKGRLSIWEVLLLGFILEKVIWSILNLNHLPVYFDDALNHWSGRGRALLTGTNWSWDPESVYFLGKAFGHMEYPLFASIWRAVNAALSGGTNPALERVDGLILWIIIVICTTSWIHNHTGKRWLGIVGGFVITAMPLQAWHITAGYAEIFIQAYLLLALWSVMNGRYILAGIFSAAMIWSKNEGLILFVPCVLVCLVIQLLFDNKKSIGGKARALGIYNLTWLLAIAPWLIFKVVKGVGLTIPGNTSIGYVDGALYKMGFALFNTPSSSILWIFLLIGVIVSLPRIWRDKPLLASAIGAFVLLVMMVFVFTSTGAYIFLENQMTIHRSLLQIAPIFIIVVIIALGKPSLQKVDVED